MKIPRPIRRFTTWQTMLVCGLVLLSVVMYTIHYLVFHDSHHIFIYMLGDIAFVPIEVLMVTLIIHRMLSAREKRAKLKKMNMVIGVFFNELGTGLLEMLSGFLIDRDAMLPELAVKPGWSDARFMAARRRFTYHTCWMDSTLKPLTEVKTFLASRHDLTLALLENPNLLEHDAFSDLLWAVSHLADELAHRSRLDGLPQTDLDHLSGDMKRAYIHLVAQWLDYMHHLRDDYPYLYSLAVRTNPFNPEASVVIG